jgi:SAM-dependent methyltransferase
MGARLRGDADASARDLIVGTCWRFAPLWQGIDRLVEVVRTGKPVDPNAPTETWNYFQLEPAQAAGFARALAGIGSTLVAQLDAAGYQPPAAGRIVDVGGGTGTLLAGLLRQAPDANGVLFDRAKVVDEATARFATAGLADRAQVVVGDFLQEVPRGDVHVVCQVLHDWDDDHVRRIAGNCYRASRPGGWLIVIEYVLPTTPEPSLAHIMDLIMMMVGSGRERSREQHEALLGTVGYTLVRDISLPGRLLPWRILEVQVEPTGSG